MRNDRGYLLLETMIAISIFALALMPFLAALNLGVKAAHSGKQLSQVDYLLQMEAEIVKATDFDSLSTASPQPTVVIDYNGSGFTMERTVTDVLENNKMKKIKLELIKDGKSYDHLSFLVYYNKKGI
ncbi:MAG: type IV pilus modification PilV family protein [Bacillota bacterium]